MLDRKTNKKGFTLVELLVVLVIIAILAAVAAPIYLRHTRRARASEAVATMSLIRQAERDQFINTNLFVKVISGDLIKKLPPCAGCTGLDINLGTPQYFCNDAYIVDLDQDGEAGVSALFDKPSAVDFIILVTPNGNCNETCGTKGDLDCAVKADQVNGNQPNTLAYQLEMDNSGRIFVTYDDGDNWEAY